MIVAAPAAEAAPQAPAQAPVAQQAPQAVTSAAYSAQAKKSWKKRLKKAKKIRKYLRKQLGKRYVYGAEGPSTFDCSGLVQYVHRKAGIRLPRVAPAQSRAGHGISWKNRRVGDMVLMYGGNHIGVITYRKGKKTVMIHASRTGVPVKKTRIDVGWYKNKISRVSRAW